MDSLKIVNILESLFSECYCSCCTRRASRSSMTSSSGNMDMSLWESNCTFSDPFNSFGGEGSLKRFKTNADNLGKFVDQPKSRVSEVDVTISPKEVSYDVIKIAWTFSSKLKLPWRPVLAASGETTHYISKASGKIFLYQEKWKSKPIDVIKRLFIPT